MGALEILTDSNDSGGPSAAADPSSAHQTANQTAGRIASQTATQRQAGTAHAPPEAEHAARGTPEAARKLLVKEATPAEAEMCAGSPVGGMGAEEGGVPRSRKHMHCGVEVDVEEI